MALLGKLIDKTTISRAGDAFVGVTAATVAHGLCTTPHLVLPVVRSIAVLKDNPQVLGMDANASIATILYAQASTAVASSPTIMFDLYVIRLHSFIQ